MPQLGRPRKKRLTKKPADMPDEEWAKILAGRKVMTADRAGRRGREKERKNAATQDATVEAYLGSESKAAVVPTQGTQGSSNARRSSSPSSPGYFEESGMVGERSRPQSRFSSPEMGDNEFIPPVDIDGPGVFSPVLTDEAAARQDRDRVHLDLNQAAPDGSPALRRAATSGVGTNQAGRSLFVGDAPPARQVLDDMDASACASVLNGMIRGEGGYHERDAGEGEADDEYDYYYDDDEEVNGEGGVEEENGEDAGDEGVEEVVELDANGKPKRVGGKGVKWKIEEDECLTDAWKSVSFDASVGANQKSKAYWKRIFLEFEERKLYGVYGKYKMARNQNALQHRWAAIQKSCNSFHGCVEKVRKRKISGISQADQLRHMLRMYKSANGGKDFPFMHVFTKIEKFKKWDEARYDLNNGKVFDVDEPAASSAGRPDGVKRAKADKNGTSAASVEESFKMMIAEVTSSNSGRDQVNDARWRELLEKGEKKLRIEEAKAAAAQVAAQASLLQAMHTQMFEQAKILTTDTSGMDEPTRKWFMEAQKRIVVAGVPAWAPAAQAAWQQPPAPDAPEDAEPASASSEQPSPALTQVDADLA